jgi:hypothetical protein
VLTEDSELFMVAALKKVIGIRFLTITGK